MGRLTTSITSPLAHVIWAGRAAHAQPAYAGLEPAGAAGSTQVRVSKEGTSWRSVINFHLSNDKVIFGFCEFSIEA